MGPQGGAEAGPMASFAQAQKEIEVLTQGIARETRIEAPHRHGSIPTDDETAAEESIGRPVAGARGQPTIVAKAAELDQAMQPARPPPPGFDDRPPGGTLRLTDQQAVHGVQEARGQIRVVIDENDRFRALSVLQQHIPGSGQTVEIGPMIHLHLRSGVCWHCRLVTDQRLRWRSQAGKSVEGPSEGLGPVFGGYADHGAHRLSVSHSPADGKLESCFPDGP
jgi:hypothetical protein